MCLRLPSGPAEGGSLRVVATRDDDGGQPPMLVVEAS